MMEKEVLGIRWFNDACYEIKLPNGKEILIDPYIDESPNKKLGSDQVQGADYILLSHTHFDHILSLKKLAERYDSNIFVGSGSAVELAKENDIPGYRLFACKSGDVFEMDDFRLKVIRGKHTNLKKMDRPSNWSNIADREQFDLKWTACNINGSYEYMNYLITLNDNTKLLVWGGRADRDAIVRAAKLKPNISIVQFTRDPLEKIAELYASIGGHFIFPHHHDGRLKEGEKGQTAIEHVVQRVEKDAPYTSVVFPEQGKWYQVQTSIELTK